MTQEQAIEVIQANAKANNITIHRAAKTYYKYAGGSQRKNCLNCRNGVEVKYTDRYALQCETIGISGDKTADLSGTCCCIKWR